MKSGISIAFLVLSIAGLILILSTNNVFKGFSPTGENVPLSDSDKLKMQNRFKVGGILLIIGTIGLIVTKKVK